MREIKFRAWNESREIMVEWDEVSNSHEEIGNLLTFKNLIPLQYIGLKDCNGKDVYEGDIAEGEHATYLIQWSAERAQYQAKITKTKSVLSKHCSFPLWQYIEHDEKCRFEIIGNMYENPDLLK